MDTPLLMAHRHGIVLAKPLLRSLLLALVGAACFLAPWHEAAVAGALLLAFAALGAVVAVARWDRTHLVLSGDTLRVEHGLLRRASATVELEQGKVVEVERTLPGRLFGYATVVAGELEVDGVPRRLAKRLTEHTFGG